MNTTHITAIGGLDITTTAEIADHWELGRHLAMASSEDQYRLLHGFLTGLEGLPNPGMQMQFIADEVEKNPGHDLRPLAQMFSDYLGGDQ